MGLEASEIWVSPLQNASKPSPVPDPPTVIRTSGFCRLNPSAVAWVIGNTVLEPSIAICPELPPPPPAACVSPPVSSSFCPPPPPPPPPQPARIMSESARRPARISGFRHVNFFNFPLPSRLLHHRNPRRGRTTLTQTTS